MFFYLKVKANIATFVKRFNEGFAFWFSKKTYYIVRKKEFARAVVTFSKQRILILHWRLQYIKKFITKTHLFKYIENFTSKKLKIFR